MWILTAEEVRKALPMRDAIEAMKRAYAALADGRAEVPLRTRVPVTPHEALSLVMPAFVQAQEGDALAEESLGIKVVSLYPQNPRRGLAYIQAAVLVLEPDTGRLLAVLEGSSLTAIRTGAASGAAIDLLARKESKVLAVIGAGTQGRTQLEAACSVRNIERAFIYDPDPEKAKAFAHEMAGRGPIPAALRIATNATEAVQEADIVCTATTSLTPVFDDSAIKAGTHISAVGPTLPICRRSPRQPLPAPAWSWIHARPAWKRREISSNRYARDYSTPHIFMPNSGRSCWDGKPAGHQTTRSRISSLSALRCRMPWRVNWRSIMPAG